MGSLTTSHERLSRFLDHLGSIFEQEPEFFPFDSRLPGVSRVVCLVYRDAPEPGSITGVTYGLSEVSHPDWVLGRPELCISLDSSDVSWPLAAGEVVNQLRGKCPFLYGEVIDFGEAIADESAMSAFFVFAPSILRHQDYAGIDVGGSLPINIAGLYPIYGSERALIAGMGLERFWNHPNFDLYDVRRPAVGSLAQCLQ
jgi:hypothetical protein